MATASVAVSAGAYQEKVASGTKTCKENTAMQPQTRTETRQLQMGDYNKGYLELLSQLTKVGDYDQAAFEAQYAEIGRRKDDYKIVVIEDLDKQKIIATATLLIEHKFIRNCGKCGHIEDVVVDSTYRGLRLGIRVIEALIDLAEKAGCYKVILDCSEDNVSFYEKCGLYKKEVQMVKYF
ncbi:hypothetical protein N2152v2_007485 [Parachlorella kessleri]